MLETETKLPVPLPEMIGRACVTSSSSCLYWIFLLVLLQQVICSCRFNYKSKDQKQGNFSSPRYPGKYPRDINCVYSFYGLEHEGVRITFDTFELEPHSNEGCFRDFIDVTSTTIVSFKELIGRYCGSRVPDPILSMHSMLQVHFVTNHVIQMRGFQATYEFVNERDVGPPASTKGYEGCGGLISGNGGIIESPGFPKSFPKNVDCMWLVRVDYGKHVHIKMLDLQLLGTIAACDKGMVGVYDGYASLNYIRHNNPLRYYCGDIKYYKSLDDKNAVSHRNRIIIRFNTSVAGLNTYNSYVGFRIIWTAVDFRNPGDCPGFTCINSGYCVGYQVACTETHDFCIDKSLVCNGVPNCSDDDTSDEDNCDSINLIAGCAGGLTLLVLLIAMICLYRRRCKNGRQSQHLTSLQLRQLDHSPSYSSRQLPNSFRCSPDECVPSQVYDKMSKNGSPAAAAANHQRNSRNSYQYMTRYLLKDDAPNNIRI